MSSPHVLDLWCVFLLSFLGATLSVLSLQPRRFGATCCFVATSLFQLVALISLGVHQSLIRFFEWFQQGIVFLSPGAARPCEFFWFSSPSMCRGTKGLEQLGVRSQLCRHSFCAMGSRYKFWFCLLLLGHGVRIGEARQPGPDSCETMWSLGTFNPSGLTTKADIVADLSGDFWGITESHLSTLGFEKFQTGMKCQKSRFAYLVPGAPSSLRARSESVGTFTGVLAISPWPTRALPLGSTQEWLSTARYQVVGACIHNLWIQIAMVYGYPHSSTHQYPRFHTEQLLEAAINRIACQASGPRVIMGDFNWLQPELHQLDRLEAMGFRDLQSIAEEWWGRPPLPTGKGSRRIDFVYISSELLPLLRDVRVIDSLWPDHSALVGCFASPCQELDHFKWRMPQPIEWPAFEDTFCYPTHPDPTVAYALLWNSVEHHANQVAKASGASGFSPSQLGRGQTLEPTRHASNKAPIRKGRTGEVQPNYHGASFRYAQQFKQVRRLQSLKAALKKAPHPSGESVPALWSAIRHSTGFDGGFCFWWTRSVQPQYGGPVHLPLSPPTFEECCQIFHGVNETTKAFGLRLQQSRLQQAKHVRQHDLQYVFRDCSKPPPKKVDVLVSSTEAEIQAVQHQAITLTQPVPFRVGIPLVCNGSEAIPTACQGTSLTTDVPVIGSPGDALRQSVVTAKVDDILEAFREAWTARWQKAHHLNPSQWTDIASFVARVANPMDWNFPEWSLERFVHIIKRKKSRAAVGPDGVTRHDLLTVPPTVQAACLQVLQHAETTAQWPRQLATGIVSLLEKHPQASTVADYRPIVIYPLLYRVWSTYRARQLLRNLTRVAPSGLRGGMPNQEARTIWYELGLELETAHSHQTPLIGLVADLEKAFNHVPREPVWQILSSLNVSDWLIKAWCGFVSFQVRRFRVRSTTGPMIASNCGYPEGCALSVAAMCFVDLALDWWMADLCPQVRVYTYVDDWQFLHRNICTHQAVEQHLGKFVQVLDMIMDPKKTYVWATNSSDRKHLINGTYALLPQAKTLGIQANYTQRLGNKTLVSRVEGMKPTWKQLRASLSPYRLKLTALLQLGWPKALHGISSSTLATTHFGTLRTGAVRGLRTDRVGTSPMLHLSVWGFTFDPEGWSIYQTIKDARDLGSFQHFRSFLLQHLSGDRIPRNGPTSILISRLERMGWQCLPTGMVLDELGEFNCYQCPIDELRQRLAWSWPSIMASEVSHRACFDGMRKIDLAETRKLLLQYGEMDRVYLQCGLDGTMYTNRGKQHWQGEQANQCPFCQQQDGFEHRLWHCKHFEQCRVGIDQSTLESIRQLPSCSRNHGWAIRPPSSVHLATALIDLPSEPIILNPVVPPKSGPMHLFTDGTCCLPTEPALRLAAWSITQAGNAHNPFEFSLIASGLVQGLLQTAFRAELIALREALTIASRVRCCVTIWSDCLGVLTGVRRLQAMQWLLKPSHSHYDLWSSISDLLQTVGSRVTVVQVYSHISPELGQTDIEQWAFWRNSLVDHAAARANEARGRGFWTL